MKCADPVLCYTDTKGNRQYRHFSLASNIFKQIHQLVFNCGKCLFCRKKKAYELAQRCVLHSSLYKQNCFLTLTYDEKKEGYHNDFQYEDVQKFKKRLRKKAHPKKIEIFNVHEYGKNGKKHWHLIVFNHDFDDKTVHTITNGISLYVSDDLGRLWPYGFSTIGDVSTASAMYQAQYVEKDLKNGNRLTSKQSHSKHSGIGGPYFLSNYEQILRLGYVPVSGGKMPIPRYFEKLARKHWAHYYDPSLFFDTSWRKAIYRPFRLDAAVQPNKEIADLFAQYCEVKQTKILGLEKEWEELITRHLTEKENPDFIKSESNALYDLKNRNNIERF